MNFFIDRMREEDLDQVVALELKCGLNSRGVARHLRSLSDSRAISLAAYADEGRSEVIGMFSAEVVLDELQVDNLAVEDAWRRRGVASLLLSSGMQIARHKGALNAVLELRSANSTARTLYERHGFAVVGLRPAYYHDPTDDALIMTCDLVNSLARQSKKNPDGS
jgi:ribosomal-protein-alanine N-acetyltransferase